VVYHDIFSYLPGMGELGNRATRESVRDSGKLGPNGIIESTIHGNTAALSLGLSTRKHKQTIEKQERDELHVRGAAHSTL
jgi:hypothetical protein